MKIPAIILVRAGSKRLPDKWALPWGTTNLLGNAIRQARACEYVERVIVGTDSKDIGAFAFGEGANVIYRPPVADDQTSLDGLRYVQCEAGIVASYCLLVQCTSPFVNAEDLSRLILCAEMPCAHVVALGKRGRPSGMGYVFPPFITDAQPRTFVEQDAPDVDVDTRADYERALEIARKA